MEEVELTEEMIAQTCMFLRVIDLMDRNHEIIKDNEDLQKTMVEVKENVKLIMDLLTPEQQDYVLEVHKVQSEYLAEQFEKDKKKAAKKKK